MAIHRDLPDSELHEPKGVVSASANQVYVADGAGSGDWASVNSANVIFDDPNNNFVATDVEAALNELYGREFYFYDAIADVSTPSFVLVPIVTDCTVDSIRFILGGAITTANSTLTITRGGDGASLGTQVIDFSGSAEGTTFDWTPAGNADLSATTHRYIKIATDGASSSSQPLYFTLAETRA